MRSGNPPPQFSPSRGEAVLRGADVYGKGVVGAANHIKIGDIVSVWADITGRVRRGEAVNGPRPGLIFLANGFLEQPRRTLIAQTEGRAVRITERQFNHPSIPNEVRSLGSLQNLPSVLAGLLLDPHPGETIVDMCAAPGGKTFHVATLMRGQYDFLIPDHILT